MIPMRIPIVAGNWKLHGDRAFARGLVDALAAAPRPAGVDVVVMPPVPYLGELADRYAGSGLAFGAQDLDVNDQGAYTGETAGRMIRDVGGRYVLVGHSERRQYHEEDSERVAEKFQAAIAPYVKAARKTGAGRAGSSRSRRSSSSAGDTKDAREWLRANGHQVSDRGRVPAPLMELYRNR